MLIPLLGNGLLTAEGGEWLRHRRLASGAFHRDRIAAYGRTMSLYAEEDAAGAGATTGGRPPRRDDGTDLRIVARTLFDTDVTPRIEELARLGSEIQDFYYGRFASLRFLIPTWLPTPGNRGLAAPSSASTTSSTGSSANGIPARIEATYCPCCCSPVTSAASACRSGRSATKS